MKSRKQFHLEYGQAGGRLVSQGYFKRAWIIQEVALNSHRTARVGSLTVPWQNMVHMLLDLYGESETWYKSHFSVANCWQIEALIQLMTI